MLEKENVLISVVLPVYNVSAYLQGCLDSVCAQTYRNLEILLVNDGSTDDSLKICEAYAARDGRIRVFSKENGGLSDARNYGIYRARGQYITLIDSDDCVDPDYVAYLYRILTKYQCRMALCTHRVLFDNGKCTEYGNGTDEALDTERCLERMLYHDVVDTSAWGKLYERGLFDGVSYPKGKIFEDIGTTYRLFLQCDRIACGYSPKYTYMRRRNSIVTGTFSLKKLDMLEMTDQMAVDVAGKFPSLLPAVNIRRIYARFSTLNQMLQTEEYPEVRQELIEFIKRHQDWIKQNPKAPRRYKVALFLLKLDYRLYRKVWLHLQK